MNNILECKGYKFVVGTYAVQFALEKLGASINELDEVIAKRLFSFIKELMVYSHEFACLKDGKPTELTDAAIYDLMDESGGFHGEFFKRFVEVMNRSLGLTSQPQEQPAGKKKADA